MSVATIAVLLGGGEHSPEDADQTLAVGNRTLESTNVIDQPVAFSDEAPPFVACESPAPLALLVNAASFNESQRVQAKGASSNCGVSAEVVKSRRLAESTLQLSPGEECLVTIQPTPIKGGLELEVITSGSCGRLDVLTEISGPKAPSSKIATSSGSHDLTAKVIGNDVLHIPIFLNYVRLTWSYNTWSIWSGSQTNFQWDDGFWDIWAHSPGLNYNPFPYYEAYDYVHWYSYGFPSSTLPDVEAWDQPTAWGYANGGWTCSFWHSEGNNWNYYRLHWHDQCYLNS